MRYQRHQVLQFLLFFFGEASVDLGQIGPFLLQFFGRTHIKQSDEVLYLADREFPKRRSGQVIQTLFHNTI